MDINHRCFLLNEVSDLIRSRVVVEQRSHIEPPSGLVSTYG